MTDMNETNLSHALPGQERYVAPLEETPLKDVDSVDESAPASSLWADAWRTLRKNPMFIICVHYLRGAVPRSDDQAESELLHA